MHVATLSGDPLLSAQLEKTVTIEGTVSDEPDVREGNVLVSLRADRLLASTPAAVSAGAPREASERVEAGVLILAPSHAEVRYGDRIRASGTLRAPQAFDTGAGRPFDYPQYLAASGIAYELAFANVERDGQNNGNAMKAAAIDFKHLYLKGIGLSLPEPEAGLAGGITVGDKRGVGQELSAVFRTVSLVHIVVLSGYNITVVLNALAQLVRWTPRFVQFGTSGFLVLFFILMSGGAASATRAGAMALIAVFARATGRMYLAGRVLGVVALGMIAWNPFTLMYDPSFQLSALATLGLVFFTPLFAARLGWVTKKFGLREIAASTLGTQLAVVPLLLYQNGQLPIYSLPANLLALAAVPPAMLFSSIAALAGLVFGPFSVIVAFPAYVLLAYIIGVAKFFATLPFAALAVPAFSAWWLIVAYMILFFGWWIIKKEERQDKSPPLITPSA